jgi:hypothetical protein
VIAGTKPRSRSAAKPRDFRRSAATAPGRRSEHPIDARHPTLDRRIGHHEPLAEPRRRNRLMYPFGNFRERLLAAGGEGQVQGDVHGTRL